LSDLQKTILVLGLEKDGAGLRYSEILIRYYGWKTVGGSPPETGRWTFSKASIGEKEYRRSRAALSRSVTRLAERGLVTFARDGIIFKVRGVNLTDLGEEEARKLLVNTGLKSAQC
jgi:hypothetical protein